MCSTNIHHAYIAEGFIDDCEELIHRCLQKQDILDFQSFCSTWKEMKFGFLYQGRNSGAEVAELSEEVLHIAKHYMVTNTSNYEESVAGLFLVYSLLNLQPYQGFAALRIVPQDVTAICRLETVARRERRYDVLYILAAVLIKGPCHYHAADRERGMEAPIKKYVDGFKNIDNVRGVRPKGVFYRQNDELDVIKELSTLTKRYSEAKAAITTTGHSDKNLQYVDEDLSSKLNLSLRKIINGVINENVEETDAVNNAPLLEHHNSVEAIKAKAMRNVVYPMKHLTGVQDRNNQSNKTRHKPSEPPEAQNSSTKRGPSPEGNISKKIKTDLIHVDKIKVEEDSDAEKPAPVEKNRESDDFVIPNPVAFEIDALPALVRTEDNGKIREIKILNHFVRERNNKRSEALKDENQSERAKDLSLPDLSAICIEKPEERPAEVQTSHIAPISFKPIQDDYKKFQMGCKKPPQRSFKNQHLKSKLKRLGVLSVAHLEGPQ